MKYKSIIKKLEARQRGIEKERDKLNEFADEVHSLIESCSDAEEALQDAIDALSRYV